MPLNDKGESHRSCLCWKYQSSLPSFFTTLLSVLTAPNVCFFLLSLLTYTPAPFPPWWWLLLTRTYYGKEILEPVPKSQGLPKKLVYKFGPRSSGWRENKVDGTQPLRTHTSSHLLTPPSFTRTHQGTRWRLCWLSRCWWRWLTHDAICNGGGNPLIGWHRPYTFCHFGC